MNHLGDIGPAAIATAAAILRRADDDAAHLVAEHLADLLAVTYRAEPDHDARDAALREAGRVLAGSKSARADKLAGRIRVYRESADWRQRDRFAAANPYPADTLRGLFWRTLKAVDLAPSPRSIRRALAEGRK